MRLFKHLLIIILACCASFKPEAQQMTPPDGTLRRIAVPILMYHYVSDLPEEADDIRIGLTVSPQQFEDHLIYLTENGYTSISLYEISSAINTGTPLPPKPVVLTFDDGYIDHYTHVYPLLKQYGFSGTFFVITSKADNAEVGYLTWDQIKEMAVSGMFIEAHTKTHPDLRERTREFLIYQILGSIESIRIHTQYPADGFAYPVGRYDASVLEIMREIGVEVAVTTEPGKLHTSSNLLELQRLRITGGMGAQGLHQLLTR